MGSSPSKSYLYCDKHTCATKFCANPIVLGSKYCESCQKNKYEAEAKEAKQEKALSKLKSKYDQFDEVTWYEPQCAPKYINANAFYIYIGKNEYTSWLRWKMVYFGDDWIFFDKIIINVDGENYTKTFDYSEVNRDNNADVWEYVDISVSNSDQELLEKIANSKKTTIRFQGDQHHYDREITQNEKYGITDVLTAYKGL